jgi:trehalose 6-phosphate synthase
MNLVAKEFVSARDDNRGVLILSEFAGAARELTAALIVNPYAIDDSAHTLADALRMPDEEQSNRMRAMRSIVGEFNTYRWAWTSELRRQAKCFASGDPWRRSALM